ncbi:hypothetical protein LINPERHAP1_LOCUS21370 [Linum perenne]
MRSPFPIWVHELMSCIVNKNSVSGKSSLSVLGKSKRRFQHDGIEKRRPHEGKEEPVMRA